MFPEGLHEQSSSQASFTSCQTFCFDIPHCVSDNNQVVLIHQAITISHSNNNMHTTGLKVVSAEELIIALLGPAPCQKC